MCTLNPAQTIIIAPDDLPWRVPDMAPPRSVAEADAGGVKFIREVRILMSISNRARSMTAQAEAEFGPCSLSGWPRR